MTQLDLNFARNFAEQWISAWNRHDLNSVLSHYADEASFSSPFIISIADEPSGQLHGKSALHAYWSTALKRIPDLHFTLQTILLGVNNLTLYYQGHRGLVAETFTFNRQGKITTAIACYALPQASNAE